MRPGRIRPGICVEPVEYAPIVCASMRPGRIRPGIGEDVGEHTEKATASMRPGRIRPGILPFYPPLVLLSRLQ